MNHIHCSCPWYRRPPVWLGALLVLGIAILIGVKVVERPPVVSYAGFFDQLEAGNVVSIVFHGLQIEGRFKTAPAMPTAQGAASQLAFQSEVPELGDGALISEMRKRHVTFDVEASANLSSLGGLPWPMLFVAAVLLGGWLIRRGRSSGSQIAAQAARSAHPSSS